MRILHLTQFLGIGGLEKVLNLLMHEQKKAGHQVELLVYDYEQSWVEHFQAQGFIVHTGYRKQEGYDRKLLNYLSTLLEGFDVVHTHDLNPAMYAAPLKLMHRLKNTPFPRLIHTAHGMDHVRARPVTRLYEKLCSYMTDKIVAVSPAVLNYYHRNLLVESEKLVNINNGTALPSDIEDKDKENFRQKLVEGYGLDSQKKIWTCVARIVPLKDQRLLVEAARLNQKMSLLIVGPTGDEQYMIGLQKNCPQNVSFLGPQDDIPSILRGSDYFISASTHEGIPLSVLEAGAAGLPCLLSDIPGHKTLVQQEVTPIALFFKAGNLSDLMKKIKKLEENEGLKQTLASNLRRRIHSAFSVHSMSEKYLAVYEGRNA